MGHLCGYTNAKDDDFDWSLHTGRTSSYYSTGPQRDHTTGKGGLLLRAYTAFTRRRVPETRARCCTQHSPRVYCGISAQKTFIPATILSQGHIALYPRCVAKMRLQERTHLSVVYRKYYKHLGAFIVGNYLYIRTSTLNGAAGQIARLVSPEIYDTRCVEFYYHMKGSEIGELNVFIDDGVSKKMVWELIGEQSSNWSRAAVPVKAGLTAFRVSGLDILSTLLVFCCA